MSEDPILPKGRAIFLSLAAPFTTWYIRQLTLSGKGGKWRLRERTTTRNKHTTTYTTCHRTRRTKCGLRKLSKVLSTGVAGCGFPDFWRVACCRAALPPDERDRASVGLGRVGQIRRRRLRRKLYKGRAFTSCVVRSPKHGRLDCERVRSCRGGN